MQQAPSTIAVLFTGEQAAALAAFNQRHPCGLGVEIARDHEDLPEVAEVWRQDSTLPVFFLTPLANGTIEICDPLKYGGEEHVASIEAALALVVAIEEGE